MGDAVDVSALPAGLDLYLGYVDGAETAGQIARVAQRFPTARLVRCTVTGRTFDAEVADVERYDLTPAGGAAWAAGKVARDGWATLYCSASAWPDVRAQVATVARFTNIDPARVLYLIADYNNQPTIPAGAIGHQYESTTYDRSVVADHWPGVDQEDTVVTIWSDGKRLAAYSAETGMRHLTPWEWRTLTSVPQLRAQVANPAAPWEIAPADLDAALAWKDQTT